MRSGPEPARPAIGRRARQERGCGGHGHSAVEQQRGGRPKRLQSACPSRGGPSGAEPILSTHMPDTLGRAARLAPPSGSASAGAHRTPLRSSPGPPSPPPPPPDRGWRPAPGSRGRRPERSTEQRLALDPPRQQRQQRDGRPPRRSTSGGVERAKTLGPGRQHILREERQRAHTKAKISQTMPAITERPHRRHMNHQPGRVAKRLAERRMGGHEAVLLRHAQRHTRSAASP